MSWAYQLQNVVPYVLGKKEVDYKVIDPVNDKVAERWSVGQVQLIRGNHHTKVLAYLSIGEAENYRDYWSTLKDPIWLRDENPDWPGNYKVEFWNGEWKDIVFAEVDKIIDQGFDGLYLDIIDAYEYFEDEGVHDAAIRMAWFVVQIAEHARKRRPGFLIFPQNGEGLLDIASYAAIISGIGVEDVVFGENGDGKINDVGPSAARCDDLRLLVPLNKPILFVEYGLTPRQEMTVKAVLDANKLPKDHMLVTTRDLDVA